MRNYRTTVILLVVLIAAIAGVILIKSREPAAAANTIYKFENKSLVEISIDSDGGNIKFSKTAGRWEMLEPKRYAIDQEAVNRMEGRLENLEALRVIERDADDLSKYGLDNPRTILRFKTQDGEENALYIGTNTASNYQAYVRKAESRSVYTVTSTDLEAFGNGDPSSFRDRKFLSVDVNNADTFSLDANGKRELALKEYEPGKWEFIEPCRVEAKSDVVKEILKGINSLTIKDFIEDSSGNLEKYSLKNPLYTIVLGDKSGKIQAVHFGRSDEINKEVFIKLDNEKSVYTVSTADFSPEKVKLPELLNETPLSIGISMVNRVIINDGGSLLEFDRDTSKPEDVFTHRGKTLDNDSFIALYVDMMALTADGYDDSNKAGSPSLEITYEITENRGSVTMELSKRDDSSYFITVDKNPLPLYVSSQKVDLVRRWIKRVVEN